MSLVGSNPTLSAQRNEILRNLDAFLDVGAVMSGATYTISQQAL
jgi:hypothetical protein